MINKLKNILKKTIKLSKDNRVDYVENTFLPNVFNKKFDKKVLVSYLITPFSVGINNTHTNTLECYTACKVFDELGYIVDLVDYNHVVESGSYQQYEIIYGFGVTLEDVFSYDFNNKIKKIVYGTGCDNVFCNQVSFGRIKDFFIKNSLICINSARFNDSTWRKQIILSDLIIALGNDFVKKTYQKQTSARVEAIDIFFQENDEIDLSLKDFSIAKNKFLWWGSSGAIHKGLDLLIDAFAELKCVELYVCGYKNEYPFHEYYSSKLSENANIHDLGFVSINSGVYHKLMNECAAVIFPSVSEGGSPGVIQLACTAGLIPIVPYNAGIDIPYTDLVIERFDADSIKKCVAKFMQYDANKIKLMSIELRKSMRAKHSYENYFTRLKNLIKSI